MIYGIFGQLGCGKTLTLTILAKIYQQKGYTVYSNYSLSFSNNRIYKLEDLELIPKRSFIALDELYLFLSSYSHSSTKNRILANFLLKTRKRGWVLGYTAKYEMMVDKRLRYITDYFVYPEYSEISDRLYITFVDYVNQREITKMVKRASRFFRYYDTEEEPIELEIPEKLIKSQNKTKSKAKQNRKSRKK